MSDFLAAMAEASRQRVKRLDAVSLDAKLAATSPPTALEIGGPGFDVIAEAKLASPAAGRLTEGGARRVGELAADYARSGAVAVSVLTEETRFAGALDHLTQTAVRVDIPVLRKDFLVDPIQVKEARAAGASGVLLIVRMLEETLLDEMTDLTLELGMFPLIEIFDRSDLDKAGRVFDRDVLIGVNSRDLTSLEVDFGRFTELAPHLPEHLPAVAESGITGPSEAADVAELGYRLALVGSSLASDSEPGVVLAGLIEAGRVRLGHRVGP
ncbi:MAG TPA: indole-3-glycerol-phosphate synthase [Acidimicrobiia bacterium]|nr:indole-3-glycerol-phosphate synthase [Acidimicrobiia bacterium]